MKRHETRSYLQATCYLWLSLLLSLLLLSSCASLPTTPRPSPIPYHTRTPGLPPPSSPTSLPPTLPLPTATPFPYTVQSGDTLEGIARRFNITSDA
ncbi:MAG: LysM peptidoglycan-binding domain-containing protein, partial [Anaerolineales bacterium]